MTLTDLFRRSGIPIVAFGLAMAWAQSAQAASIVLNGGFETGDFTSWVQGGNTGFTGVQCPGLGLVPEGSCDAFFGPIGSDGTLSQTLATVAGQSYLISFALGNDGGTPSDFSASFAGSPLLSLTNPGASPYTTFSFTLTAPTASSALLFSFRNDPAFFHLDNVSVSPTVPEPATLSLLGLGLAGMLARRRKSR